MKTLNIKKVLSVLLVMLAMVVTMAAPAFADEPAPAEPAATQSAQAETEAGDSTTGKAIASAVAVGLAAAGGAIGMGLLGAKATESIARQPEADGKIRTTMMLTLVFIETAIIYALLAAILIIFVL